MNIIGLDLSINSTAMAIETAEGIKLFNYTVTKKDNKWIKEVSDVVNFRFIEYKKIKDYSESEIYHLQKFDEVTNLVIRDILDTIDISKPTKVNIEGYSYASNTNSVIDVVGFSTLLRIKLYNQITKEINIYSPKSVKIMVSVKTYGYKAAPIGKKGQQLKDPMITCNLEGVSGGNFDKPEMLKAMLDGNLVTPIFNYIQENKNIILSAKKIPKPFDDIIDSIHILKL